ncbi:tRNA uridine 5-carboxymethylaminomethyl modification enzyme MnmG [Geodia barretti]|uniref:tRNA uridine 5-carboxymethylaminomethyl modification enzyme MnmG n=1 Tax=Geodia barretti TaxID=519541 RepID=A0AA35S8Q6_GEOBA|nr:tRNA uridine 5-carboxymethylaminomethyl modification enzyme MnmG [Geodia barretti]
MHESIDALRCDFLCLQDTKRERTRSRDTICPPGLWWKLLNTPYETRSVWSVLKHSNTPPFEIFLSITDLFSGDYHLFERLYIEAHYEDLLQRQQNDIRRIEREENLVIPSELSFERFTNLSLECREALQMHRPLTIGAAKQIPGITPAALLILIHHIRNLLNTPSIT